VACDEERKEVACYEERKEVACDEVGNCKVKSSQMSITHQVILGHKMN
jgi:hypothetical protein